MDRLENPGELKKIVKEKYAAIAGQTREQNASTCCGATACCGTGDAVMAEDYSTLVGYVADADLGLGCGLPTEFAMIKRGDVVVDLGSGAGNDAFVARSLAGPEGRIIGIDFTETMIAKARENSRKLGFINVEFRFGDIEDLPLRNDIADVVVSNCVLNLVPDKEKAFAETFRILRPGGHFSVSDIVIKGQLPASIRKSAEMYAGCVSGAIEKAHYLGLVSKAGFVNVAVQKEKRIEIPEETLSPYLNAAELAQHRAGELGIFSITVYGEKPVSATEICCAPGCC